MMKNINSSKVNINQAISSQDKTQDKNRRTFHRSVLAVIENETNNRIARSVRPSFFSEPSLLGLGFCYPGPRYF